MSKRALVVVDMQNDYFQGGKCELDGMEAAAENAVFLMEKFRAHGWPVVHVRHEFKDDEAPFFRPGSDGAGVHPSLKEVDGEPVVIKHQINGFKDTPLQKILEELDVERLLICGAMSHMCIEALTRSAADLGFYCAIAHDACATMDLEFNGVIVPAGQVHAASMASLGFGYAYVASTDQHIAEMI